MRKPSACLALLLWVSTPIPVIAQVMRVAELQEDLTLAVDAPGMPQPLKSGTLLALLDPVSLQVRLDGRTSGRLPKGARFEVYEVHSAIEDTSPFGTASDDDQLPKKPDKGPQPETGGPTYRRLDDPALLEEALRASFSSNPKLAKDALTRALTENPGLLSQLRKDLPAPSSPR